MRTVGVLPVSVLILFFLYLVFSIVMKRTRFGTYVYAIGGNYDAAELSGIDTRRTRFAFLLGGMIAAVTGIIMTAADRGQRVERAGSSSTASPRRSSAAPR